MKTNFYINNKITYILPSLLEEEKFCAILNSKLENLNACTDYSLEFLQFVHTNEPNTKFSYVEYRTDIIYPQEYIDYWVKDSTLPIVNLKKFNYSGYTPILIDEFNAMYLASLNENATFSIYDHCLEIHEALVDFICLANSNATKQFVDPERPLLLVVTKL